MSLKRKYLIVKRINLLIKIFGIALFCLLVGFIAYCAINHKEINIESVNGTVFPIVTIVLVILIVLLFIFGPILYKNHIKSIKNNCEKRRFRYLDTFYYREWRSRSGDYTGLYNYTYYHLIEDIDSKKLYVIDQKSSNSQVEINLDGNSMVYRGQGVKSNWKRVSYEDVGSFWIKEELKDFYKRDGSDIIMNFDQKFYYNSRPNKVNGKLELFRNNRPIIYNRNKDFDISTLDQAIFIDGYMEFDMM